MEEQRKKIERREKRKENNYAKEIKGKMESKVKW